MYYGGIDIGSLSTETVIVDESGSTLSYSIVRTGGSSIKAAESSMLQALERASLERRDLAFIIGTGYGRDIVPFADARVTEITCHAAGVHHLFKGVKTILDIGGQDSKVIKLDPQGRVSDFTMNDKCAAGTGRFLEVMARTLEVELEEMGDLSLTSKNRVSVSSMCTVFAESEVVSLIASGHRVEDILNGIHVSIASRTVSLLERLGIVPELAMTGGVAKNVGVVKAIEERLGMKLRIPEEPQIIGALGAALISIKKASRKA